MFYDRFVELCKGKKVSASRAALEIGLNKSTVSYWKSNESAIPKGATLQSICAYFGVSPDELIGTEKEPGTVSDSELSEDERAMLEAFRRLSPERREDSLVQLRALADKQ